MRLAAALVLLALSTGCSWASPPPLVEGTVESHIAEAGAPAVLLGPGDRVSVQVFLHPETSTPEEGALLDAEGVLDLPLVGTVALGGLTLPEARAHLAEVFGRYLREPRVALNLLEPGSRRVYVFGEVELPGAYPLDRPLTALQALSLAGGFKPGADREQVALLRGNRTELQVYFFDGATPGTDGLVEVHPDDFLFVRLSGAGTFRDQVLPIVQSFVPPITGLASLVVVANELAE